MYLRPGQVCTVAELLCGLLLVSGNDAALALACTVSGSEEAFVELMNRRARELGMADSVFVDASGLKAEGHRVTARDMAALGCAAMKNPEFRRMFAERMHALAEDTLAPARVAGMLDAGYREWSRWYPDYMQRFPVSGEETPEQALQNVKAFFDARASYILPIVDGYCNYTPGA